MPNTVTQDVPHPSRRTRVIPWADPINKGQMGYTLVMEWFREDGTIEEDMRYQMGPEEFAAFLESANDAATITPEDVASPN
ncbi:hypothetical protein [Rhizobium sp. MHM7A]|uniref:hypothetical protein n=1 Tax=Rhizobium sp. MHM7A TaxID=2583233 RepID=UPI00110610EA|nr:hypothetical protein [Rhizobium sp. MHM7A]TLX16680.1 hypothetical protein FFR93_04880 [Rhizobium sp. MHM7A]